MNNKRHGVILLVVMAVFIFCSCGSDNSVEKNTSPKKETLNQHDTMVEWANIAMKRQQLKESGVCNDLYPSVYRGIAESTLTGKSQQEAIASVRETQILNRATYLCAESKEISISKKQMDEKMDKIIEGMKQANGYQEMAKAYKEAGTTIEETIAADRKVYEEAYLSQKLYEKVTQEYQEESNAEVYDLQGYWQSYQKKMVSDYKKTGDYRELSKKLDEAVEYYQTHETGGNDQ